MDVHAENPTSNNTINTIMRWILFGILLVAAPPLFHLSYRLIIESSVNIVEYVPDMLLTVLSVNCNLLNTFVDGEKKIALWLRWIFGIILGIVALGCWGLFFAIRFSSDLEHLTNNLAKQLFCYSLIIILFCMIIGIIIELYTAHSIKNKSEGNNEKYKK